MNFPQEIIHHIFNYCSMKEEARASMICKSWYAAYSTRPILKFHGPYFCPREEDSHLRFYKFVSNTFQKYEAHNTPIHEVQFEIFDPPDLSPYIHEWFEAIIRCSPQKLRIICLTDSFITLPQSIYEAQSLKELFLRRCKLEHSSKGSMPLFQQLKNLTLFTVKFADDTLLEHVLSCCSLIQDLSISNCEPVKKIDLGRNLPNLKQVSIRTKDKDVPINLQVTHNIVDLSLSGFTLSKSFVHNFGTRFPQLENLSLTWCSSLEKRLCFSSWSLKRLSVCNMRCELDLDLPGLLFLTLYVVDIKNIPSLLLTTSQEKLRYKRMIRCKPNVAMKLHIECNRMVDSSWFIRLRESLKVSLAISRISLNLLFSTDIIVEKVGDFVPAPLLEIDQLELTHPYNRTVAQANLLNLLINGILRLFRPNAMFIPAFYKWECELQQICDILIERKCEGPCLCSHHIYDVEVMGSNTLGSNLQKTSMAAIKSGEKFGDIRFILKWKQNDSFSSCMDDP